MKRLSYAAVNSWCRTPNDGRGTILTAAVCGDLKTKSNERRTPSPHGPECIGLSPIILSRVDDSGRALRTTPP